MKLMLEVFAVLSALLLLTATNAFSLPTALEEDYMCEKNEPCKWAVCAWSQWLTISHQSCQFVHSTCRCPPNRQCTRTDTIHPGTEFVMFHYRCQ